MLQGYAFFPQLFSGTQVLVPASTTAVPMKATLGIHATKYVNAHSSTRAFSLTTFNYFTTGDDADYEDQSSGVALAAQGTLWDNLPLETYSSYPYPPPCEGSYVKVLSAGELSPMHVKLV